MLNKIQGTYRMQFRPEFGLEKAAGLTGYLRRLGVTHLYASPITQAAPGSTHGYDVIDYQQVNPELGGEPAFGRLIDALQGAGLGMVLDMVPNHMAIHPQNPWWWSVLENGPSSRYASYFDMEWDPPEARYSDVVLLPVLGDHYGRVLEAGEIKLVYEENTFTVRYFDNVYPVDPHSLGGILSAAAELARDDHLMFLAGAYDRLPISTATDRASANRRYRDRQVLREMLGRVVREIPEAGASIQAVLERVNSDPDALDAFLRRQNYRMALWKISASELGYRRFFDINTMIGLRMEDEGVFQDTHERVLGLLKSGALDGLRIDHPDGLRDPQEYFNRLREAAPNAWIVIEKILESDERLPDAWPVQGTTGYDFMNRVNGLFVDRRAERPLTSFYEQFTGRAADYAALVREKKLHAAQFVLGSDLARLTELFLKICERHRRYRDYAREELRAVLIETTAGLPVYRTYVRASGESMTAEESGGEGSLPVSETDAVYIDEAVEAGKANRPDLDPRLFDFFRDLLMLRVKGPLEAELVERFQQFTGPVMAKGVEDTAFYIFNRFVSLNEVGGNPGKFGWTVEEFHAACRETQARWPLSMLSTSTHDTKRSEDVRARLNVISEMPGEWSEAVRRWAELNEKYRSPAGADFALTNGDDRQRDDRQRDDRWPDRNTEYLFYQNLVGAWPLEEERAQAYMKKAAREAKEFTNWTAPNQSYEEALENFVSGVLRDRRFRADVETFVGQVLAAGRINALAQALFKLTTPGIPDIYQGSELWNLSLVDPDNRRPVDYRLRENLLNQIERAEGSGEMRPEQVWARVEEGLPKLWVTRQALRLRERRPELFGAQAQYVPLRVVDPLGPDIALPESERASAVPEAGAGQANKAPYEAAGAAIRAEDQAAGKDARVTTDADGMLEPAGAAFMRIGANEQGPAAAVVVPRLVTQFRERWADIYVELPEGPWRNLLTGETFTAGQVTLADLFARFPLALLERE